MKIEINIKKLTDSPYSENFEDSFIFENIDLIEQLKEELKFGNPSCFLISGYRGSGKTSFFNKIKCSLESQIIFVNLSLIKYDGYTNFLRKLIRQLYLAYINSPLYLSEEKNKEDLKLEFSLLYERTFAEITGTQKSEIKIENKNSYELKFDFKRALPFLFTFISGIFLLVQPQFSYNFLFWIKVVLVSLNILNSNYQVVFDNVIALILFCASLVWATLSSANLVKSYNKNKTSSDEFFRKTLYDDEIAEYQLLKILKAFKEFKQTTVITFDELDKIESVEETIKIINDLKSLLLCGYANFVVIGGQKLFYEFEKSHMIDDPVISSIFSKIIHIPLLSYSSLKKYCFNLLINEKETKSNSVNCFLDSLILESRRVPRKLSNIIRNKLLWSKDKAFLEINDNEINSLELDSILVNILSKIIDNDLPNITNNKVLIDFFISQLHLFLRKIRVIKNVQYTISDIFKEEEYNNNDYPDSYIAQLKPLCELLLDRLVENKILEEEIVDLGNNRYKWKFNQEDNNVQNKANEDPEQSLDLVDTNLQNMIDDENQLSLSSQFIYLYIDLEKYVRAIYTLEKVGKNFNSTLPIILNDLVREAIIPLNWENNLRLKQLTEIRNRLVHGHTVEISKTNTEFSNLIFNIRRFKNELIEDYTYFIVKNCLHEFNVTKDNKWGFEFLAEHSQLSILFEVKFFNSTKVDSSSIKNIINKFENYQSLNSSNTYCVSILYNSMNVNNFQHYENKFFEYINKFDPNNKSKYFLVYGSGNEQLIDKEEITSKLRNIITSFFIDKNFLRK